MNKHWPYTYQMRRIKWAYDGVRYPATWKFHKGIWLNNENAHTYPATELSHKVYSWTNKRMKFTWCRGWAEL